MSVPLLTVDDLSVEFRTRGGIVRALEDVSFEIAKGETLGIVGESGSGKSVTAFTIMGILDAAGDVTQGGIEFGGIDMLAASDRKLAEIRGREISMIFQNPRTALNPIRTVGRQLEDVLLRHALVPRAQVRAHAIQALAGVRIPDPERRYDAYPFELSGGMCQRIMIAIAIACSPAMLIADEPTTGLDVTTQATIMDLISELASTTNMATILITHDLGLAAVYCDRIAVMHAGHLVESAPTANLFTNPRHPYTAKLVAATPTPTTTLAGLSPIPGNLPDLRSELPACRFSQRCERHEAECELPDLPRFAAAANHIVACRRPL